MMANEQEEIQEIQELQSAPNQDKKYQRLLKLQDHYEFE